MKIYWSHKVAACEIKYFTNKKALKVNTLKAFTLLPVPGNGIEPSRALLPTGF